VAAAVNARGDALAVWTQSGHVYARLRTAGGTLRVRQTVGTTIDGSQVPPSAALSTHDAELVGWLAQGQSEGDGSAGTARVAQARDGVTAFASLPLSTTLPAGTGTYVTGAGVRVAFDPNGRRLLAWTGFDGGHFTVHTAELSGAANSTNIMLVDSQVVSDPAVDTLLDDAVVGANGVQLLTLRTGAVGQASAPIAAAWRAAGATGAFTRESVSGAQTGSLAKAAILPDRFIVTWAGSDGTARFSQRVP
jgi:hypothetical protein